MARIDWLYARELWESDPAATYVSVADILRITPQAVGQRARREKWQKNLGAVNTAAHMHADVQMREEADPRDASAQFDQYDQATTLRAQFIRLHREEWRTHARLFPLEHLAVDINAARRARLVAEVLVLRQRAERAAWGISEEQMPAVTIRRVWE